MAGQIKLGADLMQVFLAPQERPSANRYHAVHLTLAFADEDRPALNVKIIPPLRIPMHLNTIPKTLERHSDDT